MKKILIVLPLLLISLFSYQANAQCTCDTAFATLDWDTQGWPGGSTSNNYNLPVTNAETVNVAFGITTSAGVFVAGSPTLDGNGQPVLDQFGSGTEIGVAFDPAAGNTTGPVTMSVTFDMPVTCLSFTHEDIDVGPPSRVDQASTSSNVGAPTLTAVTGNPTFSISGGTMTATGSGGTSGQSLDDDDGSALHDFGTSSITTVTTVYTDAGGAFDPNARGAGFFGNFMFCPPPLPGSITGVLWNDVDASATNNSESGLGGITVNLLDSSGNPVLDGMGSPITTTTAPDGSYTFTDVIPGDYIVEVDASTLPMGSNVLDPSQTFDIDGLASINQAAVTVGVGENVIAVDFGYTGDSLPVTLSHFSSTWQGDKLSIDWGTSSELFNVGYQLWGLDGDNSQWEKMHGWLIRSGSGNAVEPQSYSKTVRIPGTISDLIALGISSVDSDGSEHYYGPFELGQSYGDSSQLEPISWNHIRDQIDVAMASRGYVKDRINGYRKVSITTQANALNTDTVIEFSVSKDGIYRISAKDLLAQGIDWRDVRRADIALVNHQGESQVRYVSGNGLNKTLGDKGEVYFYGRSPDESEGLYTDTRIYRLVIDRYRALNGQYQRKQGIAAGFSDYYMETSRLENDTQYELTSAADDPWIEAVVVSYPHRTGSYAAAIPVEDDALWSKPALMRLDLARSSSLRVVDGNGQVDPEHVVEGQVLSSQSSTGLLALGSEQAVGNGDWSVEFEVPGNTPVTLIDGKAVVGGIFSAGSGYAFSEVHVDAASLSYARPYVAKADDDYLTFTGPDTGELGYSVTVPDIGWPVVFAYNDAGGLVRLALESQAKVSDSDGSRQREVKVARLNGAGTQASSTQYWVSGRRGYRQVESLTVKSIKSQSSLMADAANANYLMIAHPMFMGAKLEQYASFKRNQGYAVSIIDYLEIVEVFGGGQSGAPWINELSVAGGGPRPS